MLDPGLNFAQEASLVLAVPVTGVMLLVLDTVYFWVRRWFRARLRRNGY